MAAALLSLLHGLACAAWAPRAEAAVSCASVGSSVVSTAGRQLIVRTRGADGTLAPAQPYRIKGVNWAPASVGSGVDDRQAQYAIWYQTDIPLMRQMHVNTVRVFLDFGTDPTACAVLDALHAQGIMAVVTVDLMVNDLDNATAVVNAYKDHPAVLMWALGNEWNINRYFGRYASVDEAAAATQTAAVLIKTLDANHPVSSSLGDIDIPGLTPLSKTAQIVNTAASSVDVWGLNIFRGTSFGTLFGQWASISAKPMFIGEFGTDAFNQITGHEDQALQAATSLQLWSEIAGTLSADSPQGIALGGCIFEWNDEFWKAGAPGSHDTGGFPSTGHPDGFANEEWFGIVDIARTPRQAFFALQASYAPPPLSASLAANASAFTTGAHLDIDVTVANPGPAVVVNVYFGVVLPSAAGPNFGCPGGDAVAFLTGGLAAVAFRCLSALGSDIPIALTAVTIPGALAPVTVPAFFGFDWPAAPPGAYTFFIALADAGAALAQVLATGTSTVTFSP